VCLILRAPPPGRVTATRRCKHALGELRHFKSEAREAGKLLEDKKVLEVKVSCAVFCVCCAG
jgi:hypothetical protein